ncbi:MAG: hypothetical protein QM523_11235 [Candidatus Pacebacteria bacterium]|nr:hypothetical protein [Candidatus Paceibacterota bacterium]
MKNSGRHFNDSSSGSGSESRALPFTVATLVRTTYTNCLMKIHETIGVKSDSREAARHLTAEILHRVSNIQLSDSDIRQMVESRPSDSDGQRNKR